MLAACTQRPTLPREGPWVAQLMLPSARLPFQWELHRAASGAYRIVIHNADERIAVEDVAITADSIHFRMPLFDSEFHGVLLGDSLMRGVWHNPIKGDDYTIPFEAKAGAGSRFPNQRGDDALRFAGSWQVRFSPGTPDAYNAIGAFRSAADGSVSGTFMTETGDYRYLAGSAHGDSLWLSCFDGTHAFLFGASLDGDSLHGRFWSGKHWQEPWVGIRNNAYHLRDPDSLTFLKPGHERIDFRFTDTDGVERSPSDSAYSGRPLLVQIMGSWCPNCLDESILLSEMHERFSARGLRVLAIAFEKQNDPQRALQSLRSYKESLHIPYPILYGGKASKEEATARLPFLDRLISYPTCIFIDRKGRVRRIRTGFYGPGTGAHYQAYRQQLADYLTMLLSES